MDIMQEWAARSNTIISDLTATPQRGILRTKDHAWTGHFAITQAYGSTWVTRRKIGSPKTVAFLPIADLVYIFTADATASYEG